jgi:hypothetical protein
MPKPKTPRARLSSLRADLRHWQMIARMDARALVSTRAKCQAIRRQIREASKQIKPRKRTQ